MSTLRPKEYFEDRAKQEMAQHLQSASRSLSEKLACACRIIAMREEDAGLAGQITARSERSSDMYWTLRFGVGFDEATPEDFIEVDGDLNTVSGTGMANPATRFHLWVYAARPDVNSLVHTHSPYIQALAAARQPLVVSQMDMTPFHNDCAFLAMWPGTPINDQEGVIISEALGQKRAVVLSGHGQLTAGHTVEEAAYLSVYLERAARTQIRARLFGPLEPLSAELASGAHDYLLQPKIVNATFDYWYRQAQRLR
ncbi:class II aldolase [Trichoderma evansii]